MEELISIRIRWNITEHFNGERLLYNDKKEGLHIGYHNGRRIWEGYYSNGKQDGEWTLYDEYGGILHKFLFKEGMYMY